MSIQIQCQHILYYGVSFERQTDFWWNPYTLYGLVHLGIIVNSKGSPEHKIRYMWESFQRFSNFGRNRHTNTSILWTTVPDALSDSLKANLIDKTIFIFKKLKKKNQGRLIPTVRKLLNTYNILDYLHQW